MFGRALFPMLACWWCATVRGMATATEHNYEVVVGDRQRWEYRTFDLVKRKNEIEELNRLGREGWDAIGMVSSWGVGWRFVHPIVLFKRPLPNDAER
jgi:hypothetical protein